MAVDGDMLSTLIDRFPYALALRVARARKHYQDHGSIGDERVLLATGLPNWLYGHVTADVPPADSNYQAKPADAAPADIETVIPDSDDSGQVDHAVGLDYFAYEAKTAAATETGEAEVSQEVVPLSDATPHEKVSLYNDDHLPYSFLWWLNKTRMEYADTYRPYAPAGGSANAGPSQMGTPDAEQVIDHQIRENIFHLQSPEEKLSTAKPAETVPFQVPKKTDPIIERFIREEPQIKPPPADKINLENKARKSAEDQLTLVTETLATIYVEQGLYPKAIAIYKKLSLKYPEKSAYFAALIKELTDKLP